MCPGYFPPDEMNSAIRIRIEIKSRLFAQVLLQRTCILGAFAELLSSTADCAFAGKQISGPLGGTHILC